ncbi:MAG: hypothetical protein ACREV1_02860 [Gammaproteobacteria bacterium]
MDDGACDAGRSSVGLGGHTGGADRLLEIKRWLLRACEEIVASKSAREAHGAQDRFAGSETERKPRRGESQG